MVRESGQTTATIASVAPWLSYYAAHDGIGWVKMAGPEFETAHRAFMVPSNSPLRKKLTVYYSLFVRRVLTKRSAASGSAAPS
jgi:hypothetical protein